MPEKKDKDEKEKIPEKKIKDEPKVEHFKTLRDKILNDRETFIRVGAYPDNFNNLTKNLSSDFNNIIYGKSFPDLAVDLSRITSFNNSTIENQLKLSEEINELRRKLKNTLTELNEANSDKNNKIQAFEQLKSELSAKEKINHILTRISEDARKRLLENVDFQNLFENSSECEAVVVSIDIRRSTELMLKARKPELFSKFITELSFKLSQVIISNFGIFDKFTGDGILAFFPKFYSGNDAIVRALKAAQECHYIFNDHYINSKECFNVFIKDVGLGIGIDFGNVTLVNSQSELTVVGIPVVYACRFSGAKAGETILNQPAKEEIYKLCPTLVTILETEIFIKNEGTAIAYKISLNEAAFKLDNPDWQELTEAYKK